MIETFAGGVLLLPLAGEGGTAHDVAKLHAVTGISRRSFGAITGASLAGATSAPSASSANAAPTFPGNFMWGAATSAYQVEGAVEADGRGPSIWDTFAHQPGRIDDGSNADVADDHFHRFEEDVGLMAALGLKAYRFSIAWPRVFPDGVGTPNPKGLDFYKRLLDALQKAGIEPFCTLFHWDLPQALEDKGGWRSRDTAKAFADYAGYVAAKLSDRITHFMTLNEIRSFIELGYQRGINAPGLRLDRHDVAQATHHAALAHGLGVQAIRAHGRQGTRVGLAENVDATTPVIETQEHIEAARRAMREQNAPYLTVIMEGRYTDLYLAWLGADAPKAAAGDMGIIATPLDFVGINIYQPIFVRADGSARGYAVVPRPATYPHMQSDWLTIAPEAMYWAPTLVAQTWTVGNLFITENGASAADALTPNGEILDIDRVMYLRSYLTQLHRAIADGAPIKGYFLWSLLDNFEWSAGYSQRFGIHYVDFATQKRTPKLSAQFYQEVIRRNRVV